LYNDGSLGRTTSSEECADHHHQPHGNGRARLEVIDFVAVGQHQIDDAPKRFHLQRGRFLPEVGIHAALHELRDGPQQRGVRAIALHHPADQRLREDRQRDLRVWISSVAAGTLLGMMLAGVIRLKRRGPAMVAGTSVLGLLTTLAGFLPGLLPMPALLGTMGCFSGFINIQIQAWFQQRVDRAVLGRVASVMMLSAFGLMPLSMAAAGVAVAWSARGMFMIAGIAVMLVSAFGATQNDVRAIE
jgi:hypothetical protein